MSICYLEWQCLRRKWLLFSAARTWSLRNITAFGKCLSFCTLPSRRNTAGRESQKLKSFWTSYKTFTRQYLSDKCFVIFQIFLVQFLFQLSKCHCKSLKLDCAWQTAVHSIQNLSFVPHLQTQMPPSIHSTPFCILHAQLSTFACNSSPQPSPCVSFPICWLNNREKALGLIWNLGWTDWPQICTGWSTHQISHTDKD